ncbi:MAG: ABC transporter permease [archaeon]
MKTEEIMYSLQNLVHRKTRSLLTVLSILMGIAAVFALTSFGFGIQAYVDQLANDAGADKLFIMASSMNAPGVDSAFYLTQEDINYVGRRKGVKEAEGLYMAPASIEFKSEVKYNFLMGFDPKKSEFIESASSIEIKKGRGLKQEDANAVVLGYNYQIADKIFKRGLDLGDKVLLNDRQFDIVGFYSEVGNPSDDANIYITKKSFEEMFPAKQGKYAYVMMQAQKDVDPKALAAEIEEKLRKYKGQEKGKETFYVQTFADLLETFGTVLDVINGVLVLIAFISLIVAAVNIMNTMYTAVLERTKEIGIMKAIGATNSEILFIFVFESSMLGFIGGAIGVITGYLIASTGGAIAAASGYASLQPIFPIGLIIGCMLFAIFMGGISGLLPAIQASKLRPVDALRYE